MRIVDVLDRVTVTVPHDERLGPIVAALRSTTPVAGRSLPELRIELISRHGSDVDGLCQAGWMVETDSVGDDSTVGTQVPPLLRVHRSSESESESESSSSLHATIGTVIGLHGGGYVVCSALTHVARFAHMAPIGWDVVVPDYRLAPEHSCPCAIDDAVATIRSVRSRTPPGHRIVLVGDSAGGGLVLATLQALASDPTASVDAAVCISPWVDLTCSRPSHRTHLDADPFAHLDDLPAYAAAYAGTLSLDDARVSPLNGAMVGLPPMLIQVGSDEILLDDARALADAIAATGGPVRLEEWEHMFHTWHGLHGSLTGADLACDAIAHFIETTIARIAHEPPTNGASAPNASEGS